MYTGVGERPRTLNPGYSLGQFFLTGASGYLSSEQLLKKQSGSLGDRDGFVLLNGEYSLLMTNKTEISIIFVIDVVLNAASLARF